MARPGLAIDLVDVSLRGGVGGHLAAKQVDRALDHAQGIAEFVSDRARDLSERCKSSHAGLGAFTLGLGDRDRERLLGLAEAHEPFVLALLRGDRLPRGVHGDQVRCEQHGLGQCGPARGHVVVVRRGDQVCEPRDVSLGPCLGFLAAAGPDRRNVARCASLCRVPNRGCVRGQRGRLERRPGKVGPSGRVRHRRRGHPRTTLGRRQA